MINSYSYSYSFSEAVIWPFDLSVHLLRVFSVFGLPLQVEIDATDIFELVYKITHYSLTTSLQMPCARRKGKNHTVKDLRKLGLFVGHGEHVGVLC